MSPAQLSSVIYPLARVSDKGFGRSQSPDSLWVYRDGPELDSFSVLVAVPEGLWMVGPHYGFQLSKITPFPSYLGNPGAKQGLAASGPAREHWGSPET